MYRISLLVSMVLFHLTAFSGGPTLEYFISMDEPHIHYFEVEMRIGELGKEQSVDVEMAAWTPGSYLLREYSRFIEAFSVENDKGQALEYEKINKSTWRIDRGGSKEIRVRYKLYANEHSVRTPFLNAEHASVIGAGLFLYPSAYDPPSTIHITPYKDWKQITTALPMVRNNQWVRKAENRDELFDSPIEIGNHTVLKFEATGVPHEIAIFGVGNHDTARLVEDTRKIAEACTEIFGSNPCPSYSVIVHNTETSYGGLEHMNSTSLIYYRNRYSPDSQYRRWLALMAHEYFHLWNVKRIRPFALGPFDYSKENYTTSLWMAEGFTEYYEAQILKRAGLINDEVFLDINIGNINSAENTPGNKVQPVADASFDAWIKYYRSHENSNNSHISYYSKGAVIAILLDLEIAYQTKGKKSLDDVFRTLYQKYYVKEERGYTNNELKQALEDAAGVDLTGFFEDHVFGTKTPDYQKYFNYAGLDIQDYNQFSPKVIMGVSMKNGTEIRSVRRDGPGWKSGLNAGDEIIAVDGYRNRGDVSKLIEEKNAGDQVLVTISRDGLLKEIPVVLEHSDYLKYKLEKNPQATPEQITVYLAWSKADTFLEQ